MWSRACVVSNICFFFYYRISKHSAAVRSCNRWNLNVSPLLNMCVCVRASSVYAPHVRYTKRKNSTNITLIFLLIPYSIRRHCETNASKWIANTEKTFMFRSRHPNWIQTRANTYKHTRDFFSMCFIHSSFCYLIKRDMHMLPNLSHIIVWALLIKSTRRKWSGKKIHIHT